MFPVVHLIQMAVHMRRRRKREDEAEERKRVLLRMPRPIGDEKLSGKDERAGSDLRFHAEGWRGSDTERITNSGQPYPGT